MKVCIVGAQKSGKSVLARGLDADPQKEPESMGTGLEVRTTKLQNINISLWEFDGYDDHYSSQPCFISERAIYVVVYNTNESEESQLESVRAWFQKIKARAPKAPVLL